MSDKKVATGGNEPEDVEREDEINTMEVDDSAVPNSIQNVEDNGRVATKRKLKKENQQRKLAAGVDDHRNQQGITGDESADDEKTAEAVNKTEKIKKKREPGIVKRARAELLAEMATKTATKTATTKTQFKKKTRPK